MCVSIETLAFGRCVSPASFSVLRWNVDNDEKKNVSLRFIWRRTERGWADPWARLLRRRGTDVDPLGEREDNPTDNTFVVNWWPLRETCFFLMTKTARNCSRPHIECGLDVIPMAWIDLEARGLKFSGPKSVTTESNH